MLFDDRHGFPALQAGATREICFYVRRRLEPTPSEGGRVFLLICNPPLGAGCVETQCIASLRACSAQGGGCGGVGRRRLAGSVGQIRQLLVVHLFEGFS
jgi:hypothetical protein